MLLYHGTTQEAAENICARGIDFEKCRDWSDFGKGFYTTPNIFFGVNTAKVRTNYQKNGNTDLLPGVVILEIYEDALSKCSRIVFAKPDREWLYYVVGKRVRDYSIRMSILSRIEWYSEDIYDVTIGPTADGNGKVLADIVRKISRGEMSIDQVMLSDLAPRKQYDWGDQTSFHTDRALGCIKSMKYDILD